MIKLEDRRAQAGFSLVEVLVAMTITLIVSGAIYGLLAGGQNAFRREPELTDRQQNARVAMDLIMRDVAAAGAGLPTFIQTFTPGLTATTGSPVGPTGARADELEIIANVTGQDNEPVCYTSGNGNGSNIRLMRDNSATFQVPQVVVLLMDDGSWSMRNIRSVTSSNGNPGPVCSNATTHALLDFGQGGDTTGLNQPSGGCIATGTFGNESNNNCTITGMSSATIIRYRIRPDASGVPVLQRFSSDSAGAFTGTAQESVFQTVARGIEYLQVQYTQVSAPNTWIAVGAPTVSTPAVANYGTLINQVQVTLVARSEARNIQGARTSSSGTNIRGSLTSIGSPRATLYNLANATVPSPSPRPWF